MRPDRLEIPIVAAPMAGGPSTSPLVAAVSGAGGLGFLAAGYKKARTVRDDIRAVRALNDAAFGVNVFVPGTGPAAPAVYAKYVESLEPDARRLDTAVGEPRYEEDDYAEKLDVLLTERVPVVSFAFGCPAPEVVDALHAAGSSVWVTVTHPEEAARAQAAGADALVAQGAEAGAHRGAFADRREDPAEALGILVLLQLLPDVTDLPLVAAGGIATAAGLAAVLAAGAAAAQLGTALLRCPEAGTSPTHKAQLGSDRATRITRAFTGRAARGIVNGFMRAHDADAPAAYPEVHHATAPLRAAAKQLGDAEALHLWAGQAHALTQERPAAELVRALWEEAQERLDRLSSGSAARRPAG